MINARQAAEAAQNFNRNCWLKHAGEVLSEKIMNVAKQGIREIKICFTDLVKGSENLYEAAEMLCYLDDMLKESGYKNVITQDGTLHISW
jgi:hypothetical protein